MASNMTDVLIIGGGIAGLAAALTLARQQHTAIVFDSEVYRNAPSAHMHNVLTWDRSDPKEFRAAAKANILEGYSTIEFKNVEITAIEKNNESNTFKATDKSGQEWFGRKVILATGVRDVFPDIEGYAENFAKSIYHCFFCKGYEARGVASAGILAIPDLAGVPQALHFARIASRFTKSVTIYTHGSEELKEGILKEQGDNPAFSVESRKIVRFEKGPNFSDVIIHFCDGTSVTEGFLGHKPPTVPKDSLSEQLGLEMTPMNDPKIHPMFCETSVKGVFVGGDAASPIKIIPQALFTGSAAAAAACVQLQAEDFGHKGIF